MFRKQIFMFLASCVFFVCLEQNRAYADKKQEAVRHYEAGKVLFKEKKFDDAISEFLIAYGLDPTPVHIYNIARAYEEKGDIAQAIEYFKRFIAMEVPMEQKTQADERLKILVKKHEETKLYGILVIETEEKGAKVLLDGMEQGITPVEPLKTFAGTHKLKVRKEGFEDWELDVKTVSGEKMVVAVKMKPAAKPEVKPVPPPAKPVVQPEKKPEVKKTVVAEKPKVPEKPKTEEILFAKPERSFFERKATWGWISAGIGGVLLIAGVAETILAQQDYNKISGAKKNEKGQITSLTLKEAASLKSSGDQKTTLSYVFYGIGTAAVGAGIALLLLDEGNGEEKKISFSPLIMPENAGFQATMKW
jgi:hypothetical protein